MQSTVKIRNIKICQTLGSEKDPLQIKTWSSGKRDKRERVRRKINKEGRRLGADKWEEDQNRKQKECERWN